MDRASRDDLIQAPLGRRLGSRLRERRNALGLTLAQTAGNAGVSVSHLSAVETGGNVPSLGILARIAAALDLSLNELLRDIGGESAVRNDHVDQASPGARVISHGDLQLEIAVVVGEPGQRGGAPLEGLGRETFVYVVRGALEIRIDGQTYELRAGDSLDADGPTETTWRCAGRGRTVSVWAVGPGRPVA